MSNHVERNRREWNRWAPNWVEPGRRDWSAEHITWGAMRIPESDLRILDDVAGKDVLDLGCGTGYFSSWLGKRGARVVGLDVSVFLVNGRLAMLCMPDGEQVLPLVDRLLRPTFGLRYLAWQSDESVTFTLGYGDWIRLLRANGFDVEDLVELQAPGDYTETAFDWLAPVWARNWPAEEIWKARKRP